VLSNGEHCEPVQWFKNCGSVVGAQFQQPCGPEQFWPLELLPVAVLDVDVDPVDADDEAVVPPDPVLVVNEIVPVD
jgi:hypothetical protein